MMTKKFIPCIYLYQGKAVCEPEKKDVVNPDPVAPVSYTHLDVYKRQEFKRTAGLDPGGTD